MPHSVPGVHESALALDGDVGQLVDRSLGDLPTNGGHGGVDRTGRSEESLRDRTDTENRNDAVQRMHGVVHDFTSSFVLLAADGARCQMRLASATASYELRNP